MLPGVRCLICSVVTGNAWVVRMPFRGGPVRANLLVRVHCQAYQPTHFTIWLYSYCRSGTLTVSAHQNTTLTPTAPSERNSYYKPVKVHGKKKLYHILYTSCLQPPSPWDHILNIVHLPQIFTQTELLFNVTNLVQLSLFWCSYSTDFRKTASGMFEQCSSLQWFSSYTPTSEMKMLQGLQGLQQLYH